MLTQVRCVARPAMVTVVTMFIGGGLAQASVSASPGQDPEAVGTSDSVSVSSVLFASVSWSARSTVSVADAWP